MVKDVKIIEIGKYFLKIYCADGCVFNRAIESIIDGDIVWEDEVGKDRFELKLGEIRREDEKQKKKNKEYQVDRNYLMRKRKEALDFQGYSYDVVEVEKENGIHYQFKNITKK